MRRFGVAGKLSPRYVGPFEILRRIGPLAYELALPPTLDKVHPVFHVSQLRKYIRDPSHILDFSNLGLDETLVYEERPMKILDTKEISLRRKTIRQVLVQWGRHTNREATWEIEETMRTTYPELFEEIDAETVQGTEQDFQGGEDVTPLNTGMIKFLHNPI